LARIVVAASPLSGHVLPMVLVGAHLAALGHSVMVLTDEAHRRTVERSGLDFAALDTATGADLPSSSSVAHRLLPNLIRKYLLGKADMRSTFVTPLIAQHRALTGLLDAEPADAVLVDLAFTGALPLVTSGRPRPAVVVCGVGPLTLSSVDTPPFGMAWIPRLGMDYGGMHAVVHKLIFRDIHSELNAALEAVGAEGIGVALMDWPRLADRLVQLTIPEFEYPRRDLPANVSYVGPVLPSSADGFRPPEWWDAALGAKTVVHVTQGTLDNADLDQLIGPALAALADEERVAVIVTTGSRAGQRPPSDIPSNAYVAEWIPYSVLLPHVDVMITNGGYGGVQHALRYGIPVVVAGESSDKAEVAARIEYAGVGVNLATAHPTPDAIAAAVREADRCRDAAAALGYRIAGTNPLEAIAASVAEEISRRTVA
jgi:UDP:flavonoid glycosyltransferase YjiC (YdhE family)